MIPNLIETPPLEDLAVDHGLAIGRAALHDLVVPLSEEGAIVLAGIGTRPRWTVDRVALHRLLRDEVGHVQTTPVTMIRDHLPIGDLSDLAWAKSAFSTMGCGVARLELNDWLLTGRCRIEAKAQQHHALVRKFTGWDPTADWLLQEHIEGHQYEVNFAVAKEWSDVLEGPILRQHWDGDRITRYELAEFGAPVHIALVIARALGISWTFVNAEFRVRDGHWYLIEMHFRPGDDAPRKGYPSNTWVPLACEWLLSRWE